MLGGMSQGLYYGPWDSEFYLGTFYYSEPESITCLTYSSIYTSFNKYTAFIELGGDPEAVEAIVRPVVHDYISGILPADLMMTAEEICRYLGREIVSISDQKHYAGKVLELYAAEDELDQPLFKLARRKNIQVLEFTHMPGSHQVVGEVLDTADRSDSFGRLARICLLYYGRNIINIEMDTLPKDLLNLILTELDPTTANNLSLASFRGLGSATKDVMTTSNYWMELAKRLVEYPFT